jgi:FKBP-type peptidyl-prolyl cis-trans isomerase
MFFTLLRHVILLTSNFFQKVLKKGNDNSRPQRGDICTLRIEGRLQDGTVFEKFDSFDIQVGDTEV